MVGNSPENLIQPHLWPEERLVWCERPTSLGAVLAQVSHAYKKANAAVELLSAPRSLFVGLAWLVGITPVLIFVLWFPLGLGLAAVIVALVAAGATGLYGWHRARGTCYAITDRRVLAVRGAESDWTLHEAWDRARVAGNSAASAPSRSVGATKGISTCGLLACGIRLRPSMWSPVQLWNGGGVSRHDDPALIRQPRVVAAPAVWPGCDRGCEQATAVT